MNVELTRPEVDALLEARRVLGDIPRAVHPSFRDALNRAVVKLTVAQVRDDIPDEPSPLARRCFYCGVTARAVTPLGLHVCAGHADMRLDSYEPPMTESELRAAYGDR